MKKQSKISLLLWLQGLAFFLLLARLVDLQLIKGSRNRLLAEENRIKKSVLPAGRGIIYDRLGVPLVENIPLYQLEEKRNGESIYQILSRQKALEIQAQGGSQAERVKLDIGRKYLFSQVLAHSLGFVGQVTGEEVAASDFLFPGDLIGRGGVEQEYDSFLRGKKGWEIFEVDASGKKIRTIGKADAVAGQDLHLSIDLALSQAAFEALDNQPGAVVVTEAKTGQVLCLLSSPSFDSSQLSLGLTASQYQEISRNPLQPFFNRAIGGLYPPGSTFKIITAAAGLEEGKITGETLINDPGVIKIGSFSYRNWYFSQYGRTEGEINIVTALKRSTDTFFYKLGEKLGARYLSDWAKNFGLGQKTGLDLPGEAFGLVPDPEWKEKTKGERWFLGNTYHFAIGQSDLTATPLQVNLITSVIANEGRLCRPQIVKDVNVKAPGDSPCRDLKLKKETLDLIKEGMKEACSEGGTAFPLFDFKPQVACKTGTAEFGDPKGRTHAWLTAFAPADDPEIVVTVLVEAGGEGSQVAAPIAKKILQNLAFRSGIGKLKN